jgi:ankyrin repeat protein
VVYYLAAVNRCLELEEMKLLAQESANINTKDEKGENALHFASIGNFIQTITN